jgi:hypothetical protein
VHPPVWEAELGASASPFFWISLERSVWSARDLKGAVRSRIGFAARFVPCGRRHWATRTRRDPRFALGREEGHISPLLRVAAATFL